MEKLPYCLSSILLVFFSCLQGCQEHSGQSKELSVLLLTGRNNHNWEQTTAVMARTLKENGLFSVDVTTEPDTLKYNHLMKYDALLSNWNSWPENDVRWPEAAEQGLLKFLEEGGGLVFFHASTSGYYNWPEFKKISTGAWVDSTYHGPNGTVKVSIKNQDHPITRGLADFYIYDELWINAEQNESFQVLGTALNDDSGDTGDQPAIFTGSYGKGRIFHTILGHDGRALRNTGFKTLIIRATDWACTGEVSYPLPQELNLELNSESNGYSWMETDSTVGLLRKDGIIWQFNHQTMRGKPFFHPIYLDDKRITCVSPDDHPWHLGQWFSWKFINGVNYWEYARNTFQSDGVTDIKSTEFKKNPDHSAEIILKIDYHPLDGETVLKEIRAIRVSAPQGDLIWMDYDMEFEAVADQVDLNRTPIEGEPDGESWGGYGGLSLRFNQDFMEAGWISEKGEDLQMNGTTDNWLYMGFTGLDGTRIGSAMFVSENAKREGAAWYLSDNPSHPFYYFSPAYLYLKPLLLNKGESIRLQYRIVHLAGVVRSEQLATAYLDYLESTK